MTSFESILNHLSRHIVLNEERKQLICSLLETIEINKKEFVVRTGEICRYDYFINKGCVKVCYTDNKGVECIIKFAPENWWVVDLDSFLYHKPSFYYIQTIEDSEIFRLSKDNYDFLNKELPGFQHFSNDRWQNGFIALQQRIIQSQSMSADERYQHFVEKYPGLEQRIPLKMVASYLGITPEHLSTLRRKWATSIS